MFPWKQRIARPVDEKPSTKLVIASEFNVPPAPCVNMRSGVGASGDVSSALDVRTHMIGFLGYSTLNLICIVKCKHCRRLLVSENKGRLAD